MPASEQEQFFGYGGIRGYIVGSGLIILAGAGVFFILALFDEPRDFSPAKFFAAVGLFFLALAPIFNTRFRITPTGIGRIRGKREVFLPWSELEGIHFRGTQTLVLRSAKAKITVDKQVDDYLLLYAVIRKFAPPHVWKQLSFPVRARGQLIVPVVLWAFSVGMYVFMKFMTSYSPPQDATDRIIVAVATYFGAPFALLGIWLVLRHCEFTASQIRVGAWPKTKTYAVSDIAEMSLGSVEIGEEIKKEYPLYSSAQAWGVQLPYGTFDELKFRFQDGSELTIGNLQFSINLEILFEFLRQHYPGAKTQAQASV